MVPKVQVPTKYDSSNLNPTNPQDPINPNGPRMILQEPIWCKIDPTPKRLMRRISCVYVERVLGVYSFALALAQHNISLREERLLAAELYSICCL